MATKKESDKAKVLQKRIAEDKARAREAESKTKKLWEQSNPAKFREQQEKEEVLRRRNEASQNESLRKLMLPRGIKEEREISIPPHSSQMTIRQYQKFIVFH